MNINDLEWPCWLEWLLLFVTVLTPTHLKIQHVLSTKSAHSLWSQMYKYGNWRTSQGHRESHHYNNICEWCNSSIALISINFQMLLGNALWRVSTMFTRSAITPPEVNGFGWNLGNSEYIAWSWLWQILGAIRTEARAGARAEIYFV